MIHLLKKYIINLFTLFVIIITFSCSNNNTPSSKNYSINIQKNGIAISKIGDIVNFGKYYKYDKEILDPLEWIIIDKNDETQTALLITKEIIDFKAYYSDVFFIDGKEYMNWEKSDIRKWLNDDFYNTAFSENEKNAISRTKNYSVYLNRTNRNYSYGKQEICLTNDDVFLLSLEEMQYYFNTEYIKDVSSTEYAVDYYKLQSGSKKDLYGYNFDWLLRSCRNSNTPDCSKVSFPDDVSCFSDYGGIRPCINVYYYTDKDKLNEKQVGDLVLMGSFEPFTYPNNEKIRWKVLDKQDDKMLLLSLYGIDAMNYNDKDEDIDWEHSSIRKWLNNDFYQNCFNDKEKAKILDTYNLNTSNPFTNISAGNNTKDKIFFLSYDEMVKYKSQALDGMNRIPKLYLPFKNKSRRGYWYLRTPGDSESKVLLVAGSGGVNVEGSSVFDNKTYEETDIAIRPAIWISINNTELVANENEDGTLINTPLIENKDNDYYIYNENTIDDLTKNNIDTIKLGQYYISKSDQLEPIEWIMLDKDEATGNQLLITKDVIEFKKFDDDDNTIWLNSYIRKWLNEDFYNIAFNNNEKETIVPITKEDFTRSLYNSSYLAENGTSSEKVFLLSQDEATKYFTKDNKRIAKPTQYVLDKGIETSIGNEYYGTSYWYLRSKGENIDHNSASHYDNTFCINARGFVETIGICPQKESGIRPAIWYNPNDKLKVSTSSIVSSTSDTLKNDSHYTEPQTVFFGTYFVNNTENYEPIEWYIINEDVQNNTMTLCSKYALDLQIYGNNDISVWETSSLREWLNNTFYNNAFSQDEKNKIVDSKVKHENNIRKGIYDGNDTLDKVYVLSERELNNYLNDNTKLCQVSKYSLEVYNEKRNKFDNYSMKIFDAGYNCPYWLRNPGPYDLGNNKYTTNSIFDPNGRQVCRDSNNYCFVRPVITIKK